MFVSAWAMFATGRGSLNSLEKEARIPVRLRGLVGSKAPSADTMGLVYSQLKSEELRRMLSAFNHQVRRNKALGPGGDLLLVAVDGTSSSPAASAAVPIVRPVKSNSRTGR